MPEPYPCMKPHLVIHVTNPYWKGKSLVYLSKIGRNQCRNWIGTDIVYSDRPVEQRRRYQQQGPALKNVEAKVAGSILGEV